MVSSAGGGALAGRASAEDSPPCGARGSMACCTVATCSGCNARIAADAGLELIWDAPCGEPRGVPLSGVPRLSSSALRCRAIAAPRGVTRRGGPPDGGTGGGIMGAEIPMGGRMPAIGGTLGGRRGGGPRASPWAVDSGAGAGGGGGNLGAGPEDWSGPAITDGGGGADGGCTGRNADESIGVGLGRGCCPGVGGPGGGNTAGGGSRATC
mmetsp:Transcript_45553/g.120352  ORF Transcript_45553/g.120352 Transcript_45553/m.120352 type:complete len:210 (-) Transcript_45553:2806-3435(-)